MPTINQLVRKPRKSKVAKSKSPALKKAITALKSHIQTLTHHKNVVFVLVLVQ